MSKVKTKKKGHPPLRAARPHDNLKASLSTSTELGRSVLEAMETDGYLVLRSVLSREECDEQVERLWEFVEATSPGVRRDRPDTWYPDAAAEVPRDPWPHSGWGNLPDMCQSFQGGWLFSDIREKLAKRVFELMYNTRELHSSKEGFTFHRPTSTSSLVSDPARFRHPGIDRARPRVCGRESHTNGEHFDQRALDTGLQCIQSSTALLDQTQSDGCFLCWPGSHRLHPQITKDIWRGRSDWVPLTDEELVVLRDHGYEPRKVPVQAGDVILWRSDLCHCGVGPSTTNAAGHSVSSDPGVTTFRAVSYTCMLPACLTDQGECPAPAQAIATIENPDKKAQNPAAARAESTAAAPVVLVGSEAMLARKFSEYINMLTGDHRPDLPSMPHMQEPKSSGADGFQPFFCDGPPRLSWRQAELYGLVPYCRIADSNVATFSEEEGIACVEVLREAQIHQRELAEQRGVRFLDTEPNNDEGAQQKSAAIGGAHIEMLQASVVS